MPISNFFNQVTRKAGQVWGQTDRALGGWLPGGAASPLSQVKEAVRSVASEGAKQVAAVGMNQLPDRVNLFTRYMTGVGNTNLQLDPTTLTDLRRATEQKPGMYAKESEGFDEKGNPIKFVTFAEKQGPGLPASGAVYPYNPGAPKSVTNTLGRFTAEANPEENKLRFIDTYDMVNTAEDPDLVSGKVQPRKAWNEIESIWNPAAQFRNKPSNFIGGPPRLPNRGYETQNLQKGLESGEYNPTFSPATRFARALMYVSGQKPQPYSVDITVPYSGQIK